MTCSAAHDTTGTLPSACSPLSAAISTMMPCRISPCARSIPAVSAGTSIDTPSTTFDVFAGVNYTRENYSDGAAVASVSRNLPGLTFGEEFTRKLGSKNVLTEHFIFYPDLSDIAQYRFSLDASPSRKSAHGLAGKPRSATAMSPILRFSAPSPTM